MVYGAHFDTQEGLVTVAIPLDTSSEKLLLPSIFVADNKFEDLTAEKILAFRFFTTLTVEGYRQYFKKKNLLP